jgi:Stage III sporulation protein AB (spore_III_AB).
MNLLMCLAIVLLCGYIGRQLSRRAAQRLAFFREYESAVVSLADSITGMNLELRRALEAPCGDAMQPFMRDCAQRLKASPQRRFAAIWKECFERHVQKLSNLTKEDVRVITDAGEAVEALCRNPSRKQAEGYLKRLEAYIAEMEIEKRKKCRLYNAAGLLTGLFIALLVI